MYVNDPHPISENTGFQYVFNNGRYYLCPDIPSKAKGGYYINPRLQNHLARNYNPPRKAFIKKEAIDTAWCDCWVRGSSTPAEWERSCYKSTLIVPMTLINNDLDDEFKKDFFNSSFHDNRTIIGYLCFDHPIIDYFNENIDVKLGYIFADILSLYFYSAYIHTTISQTFQKAKEFLKK